MKRLQPEEHFSVSPSSYEPRNLRELVQADLKRAARLIIEVQDEMDPQFRIATIDGGYWIAVTFPRDDQERRLILEHVGLFMAVKQALGFTLASELYEPDSVWCVGATRKQRFGCLSPITRKPKPWTARNFGAIRWLPERVIDPMLINLLPRGSRAISVHDFLTLERWFGAKGKFPAVNLKTGKMGL